MHILHAEQCNSIFYTDESARTLDNLFRYGSERNGVVHAVCTDDPFAAIQKFIREEVVTDVVVGESPDTGQGFAERLRTLMPYLHLHVIEKSEKVTADSV